MTGKKRPFDPTRVERKLKPIKVLKASAANAGEGAPLRWGGYSGEPLAADESTERSDQDDEA